MADEYEEMARQMRADGVSEETIARFVAEEMEEDEFRRSKGVTEIEALNQPFDPNLMNAVSQAPAAEGQESGSVVQVFQKGYRIGDKIIRHAMVVVAE